METVTGFATPEEAALDLELPLLGTLPASEPTDGPVAAAFPDEDAERREYHRAVDRILLSPLARLGTIGVIGDVEGSLRASVSASLAAALASERTAILVDADLRGAHLSFDDHGRAQEGLVDVLRYGVRSPRVISPTQAAGLNLLPVGSGTVDFAGTFRSGAVPALFEELGRTGDLILVNGPELSDFQAAAPFLTRVPAWILIHHVGVSDAQKTRTLRDTFGRDKCLGVITLSDGREAVPAPSAPEELTLDTAEPDALVAPAAAVGAAESAVPEPEPIAEEPTAPVKSTPQEESEFDLDLDIVRADDPTPPAPPVSREPEPEPEPEPEEIAAAMPEADEAPAAPSPAVEPEPEVEDPEAREAVDRILASDEGSSGAGESRSRVPAPPKDAHPAPRPEPTPPADEPPAADDFDGEGDDEWNSDEPRRGVPPVVWIVGVSVVVAVAAFFFLSRGGEPDAGAPVAQSERPSSLPPAPASTPDATPAQPIDTTPAAEDGAAEAADAAGTETVADGTAAEPLDGTSAPAATPSATPAAQTPTPTAGSPPAETVPAMEKPAETTPAPERRAPVGSTGPLFYVHVSSLPSRDDAQREARRMAGDGRPTVLRQVDLGEKGTWWRVYLGPYGVRSDAESAASEAKTAGITDYTQIHRLTSDQVEAGTGREDR